MTLIGLLVFLIICGLVFWAINALAGAFGLPQPIITVLYVLLVIVAVLYLLQGFGLLSGGPILKLS